jgi:hypothetical protein
MSDLPTISFNRVLLYPFTRTSKYATQCQQFEGDQEVRWVSQLPVTATQILYTDVPQADAATLETFFNGLGGAGTSEFNINIPSNGGSGGSPITLSHCVMMSDTFKRTQSKPGRYTISFTVRQTRV